MFGCRFYAAMECLVKIVGSHLKLDFHCTRKKDLEDGRNTSRADNSPCNHPFIIVQFCQFKFSSDNQDDFHENIADVGNAITDGDNNTS